MKKFLSIVTIMLMCASGGVAQAVVHSTQAEFNSALTVSVSALNETAEYSNPINSGDYSGVVAYRDNCSNQSHILNCWLDNLNGKEAVECIMLADIVVMERAKTLNCYIDVVNAFRSNKTNIYKEYIKKMYTCSQQAEQARQAFRNKYGY